MTKEGTLVGALALAIAPACITFPGPAFWAQGTEHFFRVDAAQDTLEWIEIRHGLQLADEQGPAALQAALAGARVYPPGGGFLSIDLDTLGDSPEDLELELDPDIVEFKLLAAGVCVVETRLFAQPQGAVGWWRRTRVERVSDWLEFFHRHELMPTLPLYALGPPGFSWTLPSFDEATLALTRGAALQGRRPWSLRGDTIVFESEVSEDYAARCLDEAQHQALDDNDTQARWTIEGTHVEAIFAPGPSGWMSCIDGGNVRDRGQPARSAVRRNQVPLASSEDYTGWRKSAGLPAERQPWPR